MNVTCRHEIPSDYVPRKKQAALLTTSLSFNLRSASSVIFSDRGFPAGACPYVLWEVTFSQYVAAFQTEIWYALKPSITSSENIIGFRTLVGPEIESGNPDLSFRDFHL